MQIVKSFLQRIEISSAICVQFSSKTTSFQNYLHLKNLENFIMLVRSGLQVGLQNILPRINIYKPMTVSLTYFKKKKLIDSFVQLHFIQ